MLLHALRGFYRSESLYGIFTVTSSATPLTKVGNKHRSTEQRREGGCREREDIYTSHSFGQRKTARKDIWWTVLNQTIHRVYVWSNCAGENRHLKRLGCRGVWLKTEKGHRKLDQHQLNMEFRKEPFLSEHQWTRNMCCLVGGRSYFSLVVSLW